MFNTPAWQNIIYVFVIICEIGDPREAGATSLFS